MSEVDRVLIDASIAMVKALSKIADLEAEIERLRASVDTLERVSEQDTTTWRGDVVCTTCGRTRPRDLVPAVSEASALRDVVEEMEQESPPGRSFVPGSMIREWARRLRALDAQAAEIASMRKAFETVFPAKDGFTEAFDALVTAGLLVEVPSDAAYREWWGDEPTMWVWRWHPLAGPSTTEETT